MLIQMSKLGIDGFLDTRKTYHSRFFALSFLSNLGFGSSPAYMEIHRLHDMMLLEKRATSQRAAGTR